MLFAGKSETLATTARHSSSSAVGRRSTKTVDKKTVAKKPISTEPKQEDRQCRLYYVSSGKSDTGRSTDATSTKVTNTTKCYAKDSSTAAEATTTIVSKLTKVRCFHSASKNDRTSTVASDRAQNDLRQARKTENKSTTPCRNAAICQVIVY